MLESYASQRRAADSVNVLSTGCRSKVERLMTLSTSAVAVCCWRRFAQLVEQPRVLDGDDRLRSEVLDQLDLLIGEWPHFLAINEIAPTSSSSLSIGTANSVVRPRHRRDCAYGSFLM